MNSTRIEDIERIPGGVNIVVHAIDTGRQYGVFLSDIQLRELAGEPPPPVPTPTVDEIAAEDNPAAVTDGEQVQLPDGVTADVEATTGDTDGDDTAAVDPGDASPSTPDDARPAT